MKKYIVNILISVDQLVNTLIGGDPDETISSRAGKQVRDNAKKKGGGWYWLCRALHVIDKNHCIDAIENDEGDRQIRFSYFPFVKGEQHGSER